MLISFAHSGAGKDELLGPNPSVLRFFDDEPLSTAIAAIASGCYRDREPPGSVVAERNIELTVPGLLLAFGDSAFLILFWVNHSRVA